MWSPFARTGHHAVWVGATAMVWMWDAEAVGREAPAEAVQWLPETVLLPKKADGAHLQTCHRGFELQHWRGGVLRDSYWQPEQPDQAGMDWFAARVDGAAEPALAPADAPANAAAVFPAHIAAVPWATPVSPADWLRAHERLIVAAALALFALVAAWQEARIWAFAVRGAAAASAIEQRGDELEPLLRARGEVRRLRKRNGELAALLATPPQAELMNRVDQALPEGVQFRQWSYQSGSMVLVLDGENIDPVACVEGLAKVFDDVTLDRRQQAGRVAVSLKVPAPARSAS